jgi:hypothetical protein
MKLALVFGVCLLALSACGAPNSPFVGGARSDSVPAGTPDQVVDAYLADTRAAFAQNDLTALGESVDIGGIAYPVDRSTIESLQVKGWHRERAYTRLSSTEVLFNGPYGETLGVTIRVDSDTDVSGSGQHVVRFPPQILQLEYHLVRQPDDSYRLDHACRADTSPTPARGTIPTPQGLPGATGGTPIVGSPTAIPGELPQGLCNMLEFPF